MVSFLVTLLIILIILVIIWYVMGMLPIPEPIKTIVLLVLFLICVIYLAQDAGVIGPLR